MKNSPKYDTTGMPEAEFQPGSNGTVLKNLLGITNKEEIEILESEALKVAQDQIIDIFSQDHQFTKNDILEINRIWLEKIYPWAGQYRNVNMSKGGFPFSAAHVLEQSMETFENECLSKYTPCLFDDRDEIINALAVVHGEFQLIHPFREGNGRTGRMLSTLMALQAGLPLLKFSPIKKELRTQYFNAIQASLDRNYGPMKEIFRIIIEGS